MDFILFLKPQYWHGCKLLEEADPQHVDDSFWTFLIQLHIYFTDHFLGGLSFRNNEN